MDFPLPPGALCPDPWKIRLRREACGATQPQVGEALGLRWPAMGVSRIESYQSPVTPEMLAALAAMFGVDEADLCSTAAEWHRNHRIAQENRPWGKRKVSATEATRVDTLKRKRGMK